MGDCGEIVYFLVCVVMVVVLCFYLIFVGNFDGYFMGELMFVREFWDVIFDDFLMIIDCNFVNLKILFLIGFGGKNWYWLMCV